MSTTVTAPPQQSSYEFEIGGMTCASCAMRIEKKLNKLDGVSASVNYATEKAVVTVPEVLDPATLIETVEKTGDRRADHSHSGDLGRQTRRRGRP